MLLEQMVLAIVDNDAAKMVHGLEQAQVVDEDTNLSELTRDLEDILETYANLPLKDIPLGEAIRRTFDVMRENKIEPPRDFTLMLKSLMTIEAFASDMDPEFQIMEHLKPYARKFTYEQIRPKTLFRQFRTAARSTGELASRLPDDAQAILGKFRRGRFKVHIHHEHLEELEDTLDISSNRISFSVIIAALLIASSMLVPQEGTVLGFVRYQTLGIAGYLAAAIMGIWLLVSIIRYRKF
jgi:ubiquinone biosynthesis protein